MSDVTLELAREANDKTMQITRLKAENAKLQELVCGLVYATHPADRARLIANAIELGMEVDAE